MQVDTLTLTSNAVMESIKIERGNTLPVTPAQGQLFYKSDESALYFYTGSAWTSVNQIAAHNHWNETASYTRQQNFTKTTLPFSATVNWDVDANQVTKLTLTGNSTLVNPTNVVDGGTYIIIVQQDNVGGHVLTFDTNYIGVPVVDATADARTVITFIADGSQLLAADKSYV